MSYWAKLDYNRQTELMLTLEWICALPINILMSCMLMLMYLNKSCGNSTKNIIKTTTLNTFLLIGFIKNNEMKISLLSCLQIFCGFGITRNF